MFARLGPSQPAQGADVIVRAVAALALAGLAVIHVVDLPGTLGPTPLVGVGYFGIIVAAVLVGGLIIARPHWLAWVPAGWRAVGLLRIKNVEHELACVLDLDLGDTRPDAPPRVIIGSSWVIDPRWITSMRIPALARRVVMTCSFSLEPDM